MRLLIVAPTYFGVFGVKPQLGRTFNPEDPTPGFNLECVISDGLWKRGFASDPNILGKTIRLDNDAYQIVGVMPAGFRVPGRTIAERDIEVGPNGLCFRPQRRSNHIPGAIARIKPK